MNLPVFLGTKRFAGPLWVSPPLQVGRMISPRKSSSWPQGHTYIVPPSENSSSVGEWKSRGKSWERKGPQLYLRQQGQLKVLYPQLSLFHGHYCYRGRSSSSVAVLSSEGKHVLTLFYLHAWLWKLYLPKSWFWKQITHACLKDRKNGSNPITSISGHKVSSGDLPRSLQT